MTTKGAFQAELWLFTLAMVGYPLAGLASVLMQIESNGLSLAFRGTIMLLAIWVTVSFPWRLDALVRNRWLAVFWIAYTVRLIWDSFAGVTGAGEALFFFVATVVVPAAALGNGGFQRLPEQALAWNVSLLGGLACLLASATQALDWGSHMTLDLEAAGGRLYFETVNPITLGHLAATTLIANLCCWRLRTTAVQKTALAVFSSAAVSALLLSGSRGPFIALVAAILVFAVTTRSARLALLVLVGLAAALLSDSSSLLDRLKTSAEDESSLERLLIQAAALNQFAQSPLLGSAFIELESSTYPHNLFIEAAMALGVAGLAFMVFTLSNSIVKAWHLLRMGQVFVPLLLLQYLVAAQVSGSLWSTSSLWILVSICGAAATRRATRRKRRTSGQLQAAPQ